MPVNPFKNGPGWVLPPLFQHIANDKLRPRVRELQRCFRKYSPRRRGVRILPASSAAKVALWRRKAAAIGPIRGPYRDRKSTRLNSSHGYISYAVFCLKKKTTITYGCDDGSH